MKTNIKTKKKNVFSANLSSDKTKPSMTKVRKQDLLNVLEMERLEIRLQVNTSICYADFNIYLK